MRGEERAPIAGAEPAPMKLGWQVKTSKVAYEGRFPVVEDLLVADLDGRETLYTYLGIVSRAVSVLALNDAGEVLTVREYRHPVRSVITDLPAGSVHAGEPAQSAARRELREETGFDAARMDHLGTVYPLPALAALALEYFLAGGLRWVGQDRDATEILEVVWTPFDDVLERVLAGELKHGSLPHAVVLAVQKGLIKPGGRREEGG